MNVVVRFTRTLHQTPTLIVKLTQPLSYTSPKKSLAFPKQMLPSVCSAAKPNAVGEERKPRHRYLKPQQNAEVPPILFHSEINIINAPVFSGHFGRICFMDFFWFANIREMSSLMRPKFAVCINWKGFVELQDPMLSVGYPNKSMKIIGKMVGKTFGMGAP